MMIIICMAEPESFVSVMRDKMAMRIMELNCCIEWNQKMATE